MTDEGLRLASTRRDFADRLESRGFTEADDGSWDGAVKTNAGLEAVRITAGENWPFVAPKVWPQHPHAAASWHRERDDSMCLYAENDRNGLPWLRVPDLLAKIAAWFNRAATGWSGDAPDLDLERYFEAQPPPNRVLVLYDDLIFGFVRFRREANATMTMIGRGIAPKKNNQRQQFGYCADLGSIAEPPRRWSEIEGLMDEGAAVGRAILEFKIDIVLLCYDRAGHVGVLALAVAPLEDGSIRTRSLDSASTSTVIVRVRSGQTRSALALKNVCIVGCGAIGSFLADQLARDGVGKLTLVDDDVLRPGNLIRHLANKSHVGLTKANAVRRVLLAMPYKASPAVTVAEGSLRLFDQALSLLAGHDLVIDTTADGSATAVLRFAAEAAGSHVLTVCLQNGGRTLRVDVLPPANGAAPLPVTVQRPASHADFYEGGCGSPVSPTPPHAVVEAAAMAARHAVAWLTGQVTEPSGELREFL